MADLVDIKDRTPNHDLVEMLESLLGDARRGELRSAIVQLGWADDSVSNGWMIDDRNSRRRLISEFAMCQMDLIAGTAMREGDGTFARILRGE